MQRRASAKWTGTLQKGKGTFSTEAGAIRETPYSFSSRFGQGKGTNPEELIGAAHAGCFSMALAGVLEKGGYDPQEIETEAVVTLEKVDGDWTVTSSHLIVQGTIAQIEMEDFEKLVDEAKRNCPISRLLKTEITFEASLSRPESREQRPRLTDAPAPH